MTREKVPWPPPPRRVTSWDAPLSLSGFRALWRQVVGSSPLPTLLAVDPPGVAPHIVATAAYVSAVTAELNARGYLVDGRPHPHAERLIQILAEPDEEVDTRMDIRREQVRCIAVGRDGARAVLVKIHDQVVELSELDTGSPVAAVLTVLPTLRPGRLHMSLPASNLERAVAEFQAADPTTERERFAAALQHDLSGADAADLYRIARVDGPVHAAFGAAYGSRPKTRVSHVVAVRTSHELGSFVISRSRNSMVVEPAELSAIQRRIEELLRLARSQYRATVTPGFW